MSFPASIRALFRVLPLALLSTARAASADLLLNELLYDPEGPDEGLEFVELWNPDSVASPLRGVALEAGDGSRPGSWSVVFTAAGEESVAPGESYLIDARALLGAIQNGPDAIRLTRDGRTLDLLGYGAVSDPSLFEGAPAADAPSGQSLARRVDGWDTGVNATDWEAEPEPTPGRPNRPEVRLAMARGSLALQPEVPWPLETLSFTVGVRNRGTRPIEGTDWRLEAAWRRTGAGADTAWHEPVAAVPGVTTEAGESIGVHCSFTTPEAGPFEARLLLRGAVALSATREASIAETLTVSCRSGPGALLVNEIAFRDRGAGEWVELRVREEIPDLGVFALSDANARRFLLDPGIPPRGARAGGLLVLAESPALLRTANGLPESLLVGCRGGWPALNDADRAGSPADHVRLFGPDGLPSDAVPYRASRVAREGSLERLGEALPSDLPGSWSECIDSGGGTPGRENSLRAPRPGEPGEGEGLLLARPRLLRRSPDAALSPVVLSLGPAARGARVRVFVHDLLGRTRRRLVEGQRILGESAFLWDGRDDEGRPVPAGGYVARAETIPDGTERARSGSLAITVVDR